MIRQLQRKATKDHCVNGSFNERKKTSDTIGADTIGALNTERHVLDIAAAESVFGTQSDQKDHIPRQHFSCDAPDNWSKNRCKTMQMDGPSGAARMLSLVFIRLRTVLMNWFPCSLHMKKCLPQFRCFTQHGSELCWSWSDVQLPIEKLRQNGKHRTTSLSRRPSIKQWQWLTSLSSLGTSCLSLVGDAALVLWRLRWVVTRHYQLMQNVPSETLGQLECSQTLQRRAFVVSYSPENTETKAVWHWRRNEGSTALKPWVYLDASMMKCSSWSRPLLSWKDDKRNMQHPVRWYT